MKNLSRLVIFPDPLTKCCGFLLSFFGVVVSATECGRSSINPGRLNFGNEKFLQIPNGLENCLKRVIKDFLHILYIFLKPSNPVLAGGKKAPWHFVDDRSIDNSTVLLSSELFRWYLQLGQEGTASEKLADKPFIPVNSPWMSCSYTSDIFVMPSRDLAVKKCPQARTIIGVSSKAISPYVFISSK